MTRDVNVDYCGIRNLLRVLKEHGFSEEELKRIEARIAVKLGTSIVLG